MSKKYILALDQGTTGSRAILFDTQCNVVASDYKEFKQFFPKPGWVEHDADEIWSSVVKVIKGALRKSKIATNQIVAIGITNQRETTVLWDRKSSKPYYNAIVWQCRRTTDICKDLSRKASTFKRKTGLVVDPYFSGTKIKWCLDNVRGLRGRAVKGDVCFGTIDSWLIWKLTGGKDHVTDYTNASRTLIFNIKTKKWDKQLLETLNIPANILPNVQCSGSVFGKTAKLGGLPSGISILSVLGDQQAALYGQGCYSKGEIKNTYGTGCFAVLNTGNELIYSKHGLLSTLASDAFGKPVYAMEGAVFIAGAVIQWLRDQAKFIHTSKGCEKLIQKTDDTDGVYFVPAFTGLGAPYWNSEARGLICGLTRGSERTHITRAALESIAYQTKDVFDVMKSEMKKNIKEIKVDGGASQNDFLMQFQADLLGCRIIRPKNIESTALGVAQLAGVTAGIFNGKEDLLKPHRKNKVFTPQMTNSKRNKLYSGWVNAVKKAQLQ